MAERVSVELSDELPAPPDDVWAALTDVPTARVALPGCDRLAPADDGVEGPDADGSATPAADGGNPLVSVFEGDAANDRSVSPGVAYAVLASAASPSGHGLEAEATVEEARFPTIVVNGEGETADGESAFAVDSTVELSETDTGTEVVWAADAEVEGALAATGPTAVTPVLVHVATRFFATLEELLRETGRTDDEEATDGESTGGESS